MRRTVEVEVDLSDFETDDLRAECRSRGIDDSTGIDVISVSDLAHAIASGATELALHYLDSMVADSTSLRHAVEIGRRRKR
ncbi:MAG TPA: hypothetical protein VN047_05845 [Sphingopyxis sp.]|uniref:hypothetical protein n=1 Tax=Sphingopyxis sp. TaxID=1908224 RepID=UPI002D0E3CE2|nr:hypothetical protein [Sphingopyxis sp.]HWW56394.1 hypothetical protein [Sphingopyxis sp.]